MGVLIVLLILFFPAAIVYYLLASEDIITIKNGNETYNTLSNTSNSNANNVNAGSNKGSFDSYCDNCGQGVYKSTKFCPVCGNDLSNK